MKINGKLSNTRRVIKWIKDELLEHKHDLHLMVTNIYPYPTKQKSELNNEQKQTKIFDFLIHNLKPKVIVTHGIDATKYVNNLKLSITVINSPKHFAIGFSKESAKNLAENIKKYI